MAELFQTRLGFNLTPATTREELVRLAQGLNISIRDDDSWDDIFFRVFLEKIEGDLGADGPLLVRGYPPSQAALSRIGPDGFADRFEVYWRGLELANAFHELNDPDENEKRFRDDARKKLELGRRSVPVDEELIAGLKTGMPPSGGIALGVERLFMALFDLPTIAEARAFPIKIDSETC
jgi:lysyl-tRNA synthetase class 2